jgi:hypothetical protein
MKSNNIILFTTYGQEKNSSNTSYPTKTNSGSQLLLYKYTNIIEWLEKKRKRVLAKVSKHKLYLPDKIINVSLFASQKNNLCRPLKTTQINL